MIKKWLAILLVAVLCSVFLGCGDDPPEEEKDPSALPSELVTYLKDTLGIENLKTPAGTTFDHWRKYGNDEGVCIAWKDAEEKEFDAYKTAWGGSVKANVSARAIAQTSDEFDLTITGITTAFVNFYGAGKGGDVADITPAFAVESNSIFFGAIK